MNRLEENLSKLINAKYDIKSALIDKGADVTGGLITYADVIRNLNISTPTMFPLSKVSASDLLSLETGQSIDCFIANSNVTTGFVLGYDGNQPVGNGNGFLTRSQLTSTVNSVAGNNNYKFTITKEQSGTGETVRHTFSIENGTANFVSSTTQVAGHTAYRFEIGRNETASKATVTVKYSGITYPQTVYIKCYCSKQRTMYITKSGETQHLCEFSSTQPSSLDNFTPLTINGDTELECTCSTTTNAAAYVYIIFPDYVEEQTRSTKFTIKSSVGDKYLGFNSDYAWTSEKQYVVFTNFASADIIQPKDSAVSDLSFILDFETNNYICGNSAQNLSLAQNADSDSVWSILKIE